MGDETWVNHLTPNIKKAAMIRKQPLPPTAKKFKVMPSVREIVAIVFWDYKGDPYMPVVTKWMSDRYHLLHKCHVYTEVRIKFLAS